MPLLPALPDLVPRQRCGVIEFPVHHMRGGTSTGLVLHAASVPADPALRDELLRHLMGVPQSGQLPGNRQVTGLGRGAPTSNKVFLVEVEQHAGSPRLVSTLAQLAGEHGDIDWSVNCGNMSSALQLWGLDSGVIEALAIGAHDIDIRNTNTGVVTTSRMARELDGSFTATGIPGVPGNFPQVYLFLQQPAGAKTGKLLPTGKVQDQVHGYGVSCVDVAVPMVIAQASQFGKTAQETVRALEEDTAFMHAIRRVWSAAGLLMGLRRRDGQLMTLEELERSETMPKFCIVGPATGEGNIAVRYFTPQAGHASLAVSGGCCLAAACLIPGTVAHALARGVPPVGPEDAEIALGVANPAGILATTIVARQDAATGHIAIRSAAYRRSTQILLRGHVPLYQPSAALKAWLLKQL
ncbi:PrpF domain-containing protein [Janthinobacterium sp. UMAB-56]|uniref:PrpF domain-containing protein n=1 Tax=Janthinobacterium sp. UMAB-56 TaxID=1365361 RepID=UPI001C560E6A|nr:PrpF domain-containing protein [Janthinobacterium sp. UMAB-56]